MSEDISINIKTRLEDQNVIIRQSPDNYRWTEVLVLYTDPGHFDSGSLEYRNPRTLLVFETKELNKIIKAFDVYNEAVNNI